MENTVSIVSSAHTRFGRFKERSLEELIVAVTRDALRDGHIDAEEIDAVFLGHFNAGMVPDAFPASLVFQANPKLRFTPAARCENACASGSAAIHAGINAIRSGSASLVLVVGVEKMTSNSTEHVTRSLAGAGYQGDWYEASQSFPQVFASVAQHYRERYRDPLYDMARIAVKNHTNALKNPLAQMQREMTIEHCNTVSDINPLVAPPLRLTDCSLISDGAAAIVLASSERAKDFAREVTIKAATHVNDMLPLAGRDPVSFDGARLAISSALHQAGVTLKDIDFAEIHDCFTIAELLIYEAMGLAAPGEGYKVIDEGIVFPEGCLPINLSGGLKAKGHPVGATGVSMHALAFRQLTGVPIGIPAPGAEFGLVFNMGGMAVANYATVLQTRRA
ncbi:acetyl-CoA acetyltransferase [Paraburkholderia caledonica]|uniref:acetyl-CoA acetyltransferase n=1 Tax=Paraburkholderia caledonica TaxID=134536 RepID=UPI000B400A57